MNLNHRRDRRRHRPGPVPANPAAGHCARPPPPGPPAALNPTLKKRVRARPSMLIEDSAAPAPAES